MKSQDNTAIEARIRELGPWHIDLEVAPGLRTGEVMNRDRAHTGAVSLVRTEPAFKAMMRSVYPDGLQGRSFLDVACNSGGYTFWARDLGASRGLGFDARQHWIDQAEFVRQQRPAADHDALSFHIGDVMKMDTYGWGTFDVTYFGGILYHLPLPMVALDVVSKMTNELLYLNTASRRPYFGQGMVMKRESVAPAMSGVHGLNWYPTSPGVVIAMLEHLGFVEFHVVFNRRTIQFNRQRGLKIYARGLLNGTGRFALLASKVPGLLRDKHIDGADLLRAAS